MHIAPDVKVGRRVNSHTSRSTSHHHVSIQNHNIVSIQAGSAGVLPSYVAECSDPVVLATPVDSLAPPPALATDVADNITIQNCDVKQHIGDDRFVIDVGFLRHVITVLLSNHHIITTPTDVHDILSYYGNVDVRLQKQVLQHRSSGGLCCNVDVDEVMEIVQKIIVNGVNIMKKVPDLISYLEGLGLQI